MNNPVIFVDGYCNLCNAFLRRVVKLDKKRIFRYASIQGNLYKSLMEKDLISEKLDSVVLYENKKLYTKSSAIFTIAKRLGGIHKFILLFRIFPDSWNDWIYDMVARNRYHLFGKREHCNIDAAQGSADLFLD